ncbi:MAG: NUDIX hydrolase [Planctomycetia bacterium]|nr:NUDIX hydrolase [Planctomycetia bacterium]
MSPRGRRSPRSSAAAHPVDGDPLFRDDVADVEVVEDRTKGSLADQGFLKVRRLVVRTKFRDGTTSAPYPCDILSRVRTDAVALLLYELTGDATPRGGRKARRPARAAKRGLRVLLKTGVRPPVFLRRHLPLTQPDARPYGRLVEMVAGMLEPDDTGRHGVARRAAAEALEEAGVKVPLAAVEALGAESFPSPGVTDEKVHFRAARADLDARRAPEGDGSAMEHGTQVLVLPVEEAIAACRRGDVPDMKTEMALLRLCDLVGYVPSLGCFVDDLPAKVRARFRPLGLPGDAGPR